jgi:undecaprenyl phosphate N,N'-diacetylbacillosamine 1-phosphate transferase
MRPGMTGLAQVNGRNDIDWYERFKYDVEYVKKWHLLFDIKILFDTVKTVVNKKGIYSDNNKM